MKINYTGILGSIVIIVIWLLITITGIIDRVFLPTPIDVFKELGLLLTTKGIYIDLYATLWRTLSGFTIGAVFGVVVGLSMGFYKSVYQAMEFPVDFFRSIPATALFPLFIVVFGLGDQVKLFIAAWASSMVILINTLYGIKNVSATKLLVAKTKKSSSLKIFTKIIFPGALSNIFGGLRIGFSLAMVVEVVSEMFLGSNDGLGYRVFNASSIFEMEEVYATIIIIGVMGYLLNKSIIIVEKKLVHWVGK